MHKRVLKLAIPNIISNITIPLVGMVDLAIVGMLPEKWALPAIAICTSIFGMLYYTFAFLRMTTSGLTAQSFGAKKPEESERIFYRAIAVALCFACVILVLQRPIIDWALWFMEGSEAVESGVEQYFFVRIWAAPATLSLYALTGWFIGMQNTRTPMWVAIIINLVNVTLSYFFAIVMGMGLVGVAWGTLIAQYSGVCASFLMLRANYRRIFRGSLFSVQLQKSVFRWSGLRGFIGVSGNIFIRTVCLVSVFTYFTKAGSEQGDVVLATNAILMQLFTLFAYFMDGFAYAGEALVGRYYGARDYISMHGCVKASFGLSFLVAVLFSLFYYFGGDLILSIFTDRADVLVLASEYLLWAACVPLCGFGAFLLDGLLVGMTLSAQMRNTMFISCVLFYGLYFGFVGEFGNSALWVAFLTFLASRCLIQLYFYSINYKKLLVDGGKD